MLSRNSHRALVFLAFSLAAFLLTFADAVSQRAARAATLEANARLVARLGLTDLCLFTEAHYIRHPSQADLHSAFQDHPFGLEHFQSGALLPPLRELSVFIKKSGVSYPVLLDKKSAIARQYGVVGLPTTYFIGADGLIKAKVVGEADEAVFDKLAGELL